MVRTYAIWECKRSVLFILIGLACVRFFLPQEICPDSYLETGYTNPWNKCGLRRGSGIPAM